LINISIIQLQYITALDEHRNFVKAAESCFVTQPTLSMQIKKLEEELGVLLFDRSHHPVIPTDVGEVVIAQARKILQDTKRIEHLVHEHKDKIGGELIVGIIPTVSNFLMPGLIHAISQQLPDLRLKIKELFTEDIIKGLHKDHLDVGILSTPLHEENIIEEPLFYEKFKVYLNKKHPSFNKDRITADDLSQDKLWLLSEGNCFRAQTVNLCNIEWSQRNPVNFEYESGSLETLKKIVDLEGGATILPQWATLDLCSDNKEQLKPFGKDEEVREVSLVYTRHFAKSKLVTALKEITASAVPPELKANDGLNVVEFA
jgi:LysR family hydrogen peroxide-inducible transcriptional activator